MFVKHTDTYQFLDPTFFHPYHWKKGIPYCQDLRLNRICLDNENFDIRCNDLKKWLMERDATKNYKKVVLSFWEHS